MNPLRRPSMAERMKSTPLPVGKPSISKYGHSVSRTSQLGLTMFTPPSSPRHSRSSSDLSNISDISFSDGEINSSRHDDQKTSALGSGGYPYQYTTDGTLICPFEVEIWKDVQGRDQLFGHGAWSNVYKGTCLPKSSSGLLTPPLSPIRNPPILVAVKQPARKDARPILESEARILTHLMSEAAHEKHIVSFYGVVPSDLSLVLTATPLSLDNHIKKSAVSARTRFTTWNMSEPVVGSTTIWLDLACKLVTGLAWLHNNAMVVHGDIKPGNILLDRSVTDDDDTDTTKDRDQFIHEPLFADFSSSQRLGDEVTLNTLSAVTREYTAPELLSSKVLSDPKSRATIESDVFSLAVTLLAAATGNTMIYSGSVFQRQAMATQGWMVIQAIRNGPMEEGARVPRKGVVERALSKAVLRQSTDRIEASTWKSELEELIRTQPIKL